jgi:hypothetical protein
MNEAGAGRAAQVRYNVCRVDVFLHSPIKNSCRQASAALLVGSPTQKNLAFSAWLVRVCVRMPCVVAAIPFVAAAFTAAAHAAANALAPDFAGRNEHPVPSGKGTVYEEHVVSVLSGIESVAVSKG